MNKLFLAIFYAFCGLLLALCINLIISTNVWLEMRIHTNVIIEICIALGIVLSLLKNSASVALFYFLQTSMFLISFWIFKMNLIYYIIRDFYLQDLSISYIQIIFLGLLSLINIIIGYHFYFKRFSFFTNIR